MPYLFFETEDQLKTATDHLAVPPRGRAPRLSDEPAAGSAARSAAPSPLRDASRCADPGGRLARAPSPAR
jgi:hypothetical protein